jgi:hypothetical protein
MTSMKKEEARRAVLSEYDRRAKKHPNKASMMRCIINREFFFWTKGPPI